MDFSLDFNQFFEVKFIDSVYYELPYCCRTSPKTKICQFLNLNRIWILSYYSSNCLLLC